MNEDIYAAEIRALTGLFAAHPDFGRAEAQYFINTHKADARAFWSAPAGFYRAPGDLQATFSEIYDRGVWRGGSGAGSDVQNALLYEAYVQHLIRQPGVRSIIDLGCGDWRFTRYLDLGDCDYLGVDIVASVVERNQTTYGSARVRFQQADITTFEVPPCDLVLCKDVLQHLSNAHVLAVLGRLAVAKTALVTNDYIGANQDCSDGDTRPLDPTATPFTWRGEPRLAFSEKVAFLAQR
jgi:SAM-dependent methyltransferase